VQLLRSLCTNVAGDAWRAAGTGLRRAMCWRSCDEVRWFNRVYGLCQELAGDSQWFSVDELS
jgi:hypothetical protein